MRPPVRGIRAPRRPPSPARTRRQGVAALGALVLASCASAPLARPTVPAAIDAPTNVVPALRWFARGTQNYTCTAKTEGGAEWKLTAPEAILYESAEPNAAQVGTHGAGPSWTANDGSRFVGDAARAKRAASPDAGSIPWLLVPRKDDGAATGTLGGLEFVQRVDTAGGQPPASGCEAATLGAQTKVPYSATYIFYRAS
jgi:hypothetical protein